MRTSKTVSITLPYDMLARAAELARTEDRTMSELIREALRQYERNRQWEDIHAYGRARAKKLGITEKDVVPLVKEVREELMREYRHKTRRKTPKRNNGKKQPK